MEGYSIKTQPFLTVKYKIKFDVEHNNPSQTTLRFFHTYSNKTSRHAYKKNHIIIEIICYAMLLLKLICSMVFFRVLLVLQHIRSSVSWDRCDPSGNSWTVRCRSSRCRSWSWSDCSGTGREGPSRNHCGWKMLILNFYHGVYL